jgi:putative membrane protein
MNSDHRQPRAFVLPDENAPVKSNSRKRAPDLVFERETEHADLVVLPTTSTSPRRRFRWLGLLASALFALFSMWASLSLVQLVESFFARSAFLGWTAFALAGIAGVAALAIIAKEVVGLWRLNTIEHLQEQAARAINLDEALSADHLSSSLTTLYSDRPDLKRGLQELRGHAADILDPRDRVRLAERLLLTPLDEAAHKLIAKRARRVTLLTTVTPTAVLDILIVASQNLGLLRDIATLYGGRPSTLSTLKLARMVATHLAVTGGLALSDNLIQHVVGRGLLGKLSARFGEGAVNGILTSRIGLAACDVCRPIPKEPATRETLTSLLKEVLTFGEKDEADNAKD